MALRTFMEPTTARVTTPPGMIPQLTSDKPKVASSAAMAMSQETRGVNAPPKHQPFTIAMVGLGKFMSCRHCQFAAERRTRICLLNGMPSVARKNSRRSIPAENESPAPVRTSTPQRSSSSSASSTSTISSLSAGLMQLRFSGRFSVTQAIWSSNSTRTFLPPGTFSVEVFSVEGLAGILIPSHLRHRTRRGIADG